MMLSVGEKILEKLIARGAEKSTVKIMKFTVHELNVERNEIALFRTVINSRATMKIITGQRMASLTINDLSDESVDEAVDSLYESAAVSLPDPAHDIGDGDGVLKSFSCNTNNPSQDKMVEKLTAFLKQVGERYPKIIIGESQLSFQHVESLHLNSAGVRLFEEANSFNLGLMITSKDGENTSSFNSVSQGYASLDDIDSLLDNEAFTRIFAQLSEQTETKAVSEKFVGDVIVTPECMGSVLWMMISPLADYKIIAGSSIYRDKLGKQIASPLLTLKAEPLSDEYAVQSFCTSDGFLCENETIIENGVLNTFLLSLYGSRKSSHARSLSEGSMMSIVPGSQPLAEIIKGCKRGILLCRFSGGNPNDNGDFSGVAKNSYYIENGEIKFPVSETMVSGNTAQMMMNISEISKEYVNDGYEKMPWVKIAGVTVSGGKIDGGE